MTFVTNYNISQQMNRFLLTEGDIKSKLFQNEISKELKNPIKLSPKQDESLNTVVKRCWTAEPFNIKRFFW